MSNNILRIAACCIISLFISGTNTVTSKASEVQNEAVKVESNESTAQIAQATLAVSIQPLPLVSEKVVSEQVVSTASVMTSATVKSTTSVSLRKSTLRRSVVKYALRFKGNPYVYGGTSLTRGTDCSGFTQAVLKKYGIRISRTSRSQAVGGKVISVKKAQPGDLFFYRKNGRVNHVAMYIGSGKVISASNKKSGIKVIRYNYRRPYKVVSYIN